MCVWGIDPSTTALGVALLSSKESFTCTIYPHDRKADWWVRSLSICESLLSLLQSVGHADMHRLTMEMPSVYKGRGNTSVKLGDVRGMVMVTFQECFDSLSISHPPPAALKKRLAGKGNASKKQMIAAAQDYWVDGIGTEHEADALACALIGLEQCQQ